MFFLLDFCPIKSTTFNVWKIWNKKQERFQHIFLEKFKQMGEGFKGRG